MDVRYRRSFLRDLKKLKKRPIYDAVFTLAFETLPEAEELTQVPGVKAMKGHAQRYRPPAPDRRPPRLSPPRSRQPP